MPIQLTVVFAATCFAGTLMFLHGVSLNFLERRVTRCRSCGGIAGRTCTCNRED